MMERIKREGKWDEHLMRTLPLRRVGLAGSKEHENDENRRA